MESNNQEESIKSCEEVDQIDLQKNDLGVGRSYECVFCKRGFNTAQALGGHMNIHRRDRTRNKAASTNANQQEENQFGLRSSYGDQSIDHHFVHNDHHSSLSNPADFLASTVGSRPLYRSHFPDDDLQCSSNDIDCVEKQHQNTLISDDRSLSWRSDNHRMVLDDLEMNRQGIMNQKEEVLDLELRLGYDS